MSFPLREAFVVNPPPTLLQTELHKAETNPSEKKANVIDDDWRKPLPHSDNTFLIITPCSWLQLCYMPTSNEISKSQLPQREHSTLHHWFFRTEPRDTNLSVNRGHNRQKYNTAFWVTPAAIHTFFLIRFLLNAWLSRSLDNALFTDIRSATSSHPIIEGCWRAFWEIIKQKRRSTLCPNSIL